MSYLEIQQNDAKAAKEEARRLRTKMKTFQKYAAGWGVFLSHFTKKCIYSQSYINDCTFSASLNVNETN